MSDIDEARSIRYLMDALNDKSVAELLFNSKYNQPALFHIEQLCEKSTKACLATIGILLTKEHLFANNVKEDIMPVSGELEADFKRYLPLLRKLQLLYVRTRYGVDVEGRISLDEYNETFVQDVYSQSLDYMELCFKFVERKYGKPLPRDPDGLKRYFKSKYIGFVTK
jgi:HEPN domain-containing protein